MDDSSQDPEDDKVEEAAAPPANSPTASFEQVLAEPGPGHYRLRLYITGTTPQSTRAITNLKRLCAEYLDGRYELEVIDIYQQPELAKSEQILAAPTLIKTLPLPLRRLIGNLSDEERVLLGLGIQPLPAAAEEGGP